MNAVLAIVLAVPMGLSPCSADISGGFVIRGCSETGSEQGRVGVSQNREMPSYGTVSVAELRGVKLKKEHKPLPYTTPDRRYLEYRNLFGTSSTRGEFVGGER